MTRDIADFRIAQESEIDRLATCFAAELPPTAVLGLSGTLGAGKTRFVQGLAHAAGIDRREVTSPTFVLCQHYHGDSVTIHHLDVYRLRDEDEWDALGVDELAARGGWLVVEWADRFAEQLPASRLDVEIDVTGELSRQVKVVATDASMAAVLRRIARRWASH